MNDELLTVEDLCKYLNVKKCWVREKCRSNSIPFIRLGRLLRFNKSDIDQWLNSRRDISVADNSNINTTY